MDLVKLCSKLSKGALYLKDDYEDIVLKIVVIDNSTHCFIKRRGRKEIEVNSTDKDIFESKMYGKEISKEEYDKFQ
ncbi:MAG: hypothetical protein SOZ07_08055 [Prevotella sp.]|nr:hypothetical protein [Prevotella sp.]MDD7272779.1 hypothetical protein [Prevotellaceae bacterium]MDY3936583.1 hypothetical protein [Prevotella sp.]